MEQLEKGTFFHSYYEASKHIPENERLRYYDRIFQYLFYGNDEPGEGISEALFQAVKPNVRVSREKSLAGSKGGSKSKATGNQNASKDEVETKQKPSKNEAKTKQKPTKEKGKEKGKEKEKEKENKQIQETKVSTTEVVPVEQLEFGKPDINSLISILKAVAKEMGIAYDNTQERNFARHICTAKQFGEQAGAQNMSRNEYAIKVMQASVATKFWRGVASGPKRIYQHHAEIYNEYASKAHDTPKSYSSL